MQTRTSRIADPSFGRQPARVTTATQLRQASAAQVLDIRETQSIQRQVQSIASQSSAVSQLKLLQTKMAAKAEVTQRVEDELVQGKFGAVQRVEEDETLQGKFASVQRVEDEEALQGKFDTAQRVEEDEPSTVQAKLATTQRVEDEALLQGKFGTAQLAEKTKPNNTGLPNQLKVGIESLSGMSMDHVKVHYNSSQPAQLNAHAYAQGSDIHVAPGQEQHIPHEAWHVVQQAQGRVQPTMQMKEGVPVNDDAGLEHEADAMGEKAMQLKSYNGSCYVNVNKDNAGDMQTKMQMQHTTAQDQQGAQVIQQRWQDVSNNSKRVTQLRQVHPQTSAGAALAPVGAAVTFDDQSPATLNHYTLALAPAANRNAAVQNIQTEYRAFGTSLGNGVDSFISRGALNAWRGASAAQGNLIYQQLTGAGVPIPAPAVASDQNRSMAVHTFSPNGENAGIAWRTPAMMDHLRNWAALPLVDPVKISVSSPIAGGGNVATDIEFTEAHRGYVTHVSALGSNAPMARVAKYGDGTGGTRDGTSNVAPLDRYSMTHHSDSATTVDAQMNAAAAGGSTLAEKEEGVDAITKVIAEGGRFNCVAALGGNLTNDSKFYTTDPDDHDRLIYMDFRTLWVQWTSLFNKRYGIDNATVRDEIRQLWLSEGQGRVDSMNEDAAGANDYDLRV